VFFILRILRKRRGNIHADDDEDGGGGGWFAVLDLPSSFIIAKPDPITAKSVHHLV
jgi:hypothetical protein